MKVLVFFLLTIFFAKCKADDTRLHPACKDPQPKKCVNPFGMTIEKGYYDDAEKKCKTFAFFAGCGYNRNFFYGLHHCKRFCEKTPEEVCSVPFKPRPGGMTCETLKSRYYYKASEKKCVEFQYGGCDIGNPNNFYTEDECTKFCGNV